MVIMVCFQQRHDKQTLLGWSDDEVQHLSVQQLSIFMTTHHDHSFLVASAIDGGRVDSEEKFKLMCNLSHINTMDKS